MRKPQTPETRVECKKCGCRLFNVLQTLHTRRGIRRRRECNHCGHRVSTLERIDKTDKSKEI